MRSQINKSFEKLMQLKSKCYKITHGGHLIRIKTFNPSPKNSILTKKCIVMQQQDGGQYVIVLKPF